MAILEDQFISFSVCLCHMIDQCKGSIKTIIVLEMSNLTDKAINY